jgi:hypothetical protein
VREAIAESGPRARNLRSRRPCLYPEEEDQLCAFYGLADAGASAPTTDEETTR